MIGAMPRPRPPHLRLEKTRHGRRVWYVRFGNGPRIRIKGEYGTPEFEAAYRAALAFGFRAPGVNKSAHGVRKIGATRAANNGATVSELEAIFGWIGGRMASLYTQAADRAHLARRAIDKLTNENRTSIAAPIEKVRRENLKD